MAEGAEQAPVRVTVLYSPGAREVREWELALAPGATVLQALQASGLPMLLADTELANAAVGVWGRKARLDQVLVDRDRIEVYRPLRVDPKLARRERFQKQGTRTAGLFTRKRPDPSGR
jgi:putative ubiquitin-RnfH superfamily antitoxin RatB of RatAB toxin-antitoxin module